jgi:aromatic ring hydroxylase
MYTYQPAEIRTQADYVSSKYPDHSDHMAVGQLVQKATKNYEAQHFNNLVEVPIKYYIGYPIHSFSENVSGSDLIAKEKAFFAYSNYDNGVCRSMADCNRIASAYSIYLKRQYSY